MDLTVAILFCILFMRNFELGKSKLEELLTNDEMKLIFNADRNSLPEYELIEIHKNLRVKREDFIVAREIFFNAFNNNINLILEPKSHLYGRDTPIYRLTGFRDPQKWKIEKFPIPLPESMRILEDYSKNAAIVEFQDNDGHTNYHGVIGNDLIIKPIPSRLHNRTARHVAIKQPVREMIIRKSGTYTEPSVFGLSKEKFENNHNREKRADTDKTAWIRVLPYLDWDTMLHHNFDVHHMAIYEVAFWNSVDIYLRQLDAPKVRLNLAGIIIPSGDLGFHEYIDKRLTINTTFDRITELLGRFSNDIPPDSYNVAFVKISTLYLNNSDDGRVVGVAGVRALCHPVWSRAIVADRGHFDGIPVAVHEIGHLMGASHPTPDNPNPAYKYNKNLEECQKKYSEPEYLMRPEMHIPPPLNVHYFSDCSKAEIRHYLLHGYHNRCMFDDSRVRNIVPYRKILPGRLIDRDWQCQKEFGVDYKADPNQDNNCFVLFCIKEGFIFDTHDMSRLPPLDGTPCQSFGLHPKICLMGKCVKKPQ